MNVTVASVLTQGRDNYSHWVQTYQVSYSNDGISFRDYELGGAIKVGLIGFMQTPCLVFWPCLLALSFVAYLL